MDEGGYVILVVALVMLLALLLPMGGAVILEHANMTSSAKRAQELISLRNHESLKLSVNPDNIVIYNTGSTLSIVKAIVVKNPDNSLSVFDHLGGEEALYINVLDNQEVPKPIDEGTIGALTSLGNVFWED